jgi:hypothetical protein
MTFRPQAYTLLTRRRLLQGTLGGIAGFATWQGWPRLQVAMAQKGEPAGQMTWAVHISIAPTWFDPAETSGIITPFLFLYAMHDALVKPMPDNQMHPASRPSGVRVRMADLRLRVTARGEVPQWRPFYG